MRSLDDIKFKTSACVYYLFVALLIFNDGLGNSLLPNYAESTLQQLLLLAELGCAVLCLFFQRHNKPDLLFFAGVFCIGCAAYLFGHRTGLLLTLLAAALGRSAKVDTLLRLIFWEKLLIFLFVVGLSLIGFLPGRESLFALTNSTQKGATLGYTHANTFSATVVMLLLLFTAINRERLNLFHLGLILITEVVNYIIARSRIGLIVILLLILLTVCTKYLPLKSLLFRGSKWILLLILFINFTFVFLRIFADNELLSAIDIKVFNGRMGFSAIYLQTYPLSILGAELDESLIAAKSWYYALDNGYTIILLYYGIAGFAAFLLTYQKTILELIRKQQSTLVIIAVCFTIWMMFEGITLTASGNFIFLLLGKDYYQPPRRKRIAW